MTKVRFARRALRDVERLHAWWRANRESAPRLFAAEVAEAVRLLRVSPEIGPVDAGLSRESLYMALSGERSPDFETILRVIAALGLSLHVAPEHS